MTDAIIILTEEPLRPIDVTKILGLHEGEQLTYRVLVPADTERNVLTSVLNHLVTARRLLPTDRSRS